ncbi:hypothetical protein [Anaerobiospirillum succiniciproducens]|uniref:hypothetical protein n=1 Tax=Anaerobiospirillum succiniciproducens TaxID=13335 RepID=UPI002355C945|nr:hypothetical protein [Anaerobiospirillum succiniciproducens]MCI6863064.1 hypothetical protein [Anaerobiospirillum succiniciproducens]
MTASTNKTNFAQNLDASKVSVSSKTTDKPRVFSNITRLIAHKIGCERTSDDNSSCLDHLGLVINDTASSYGMFINSGYNQNLHGTRGYANQGDEISSASKLKGYVAICINALPQEFHESAYEKTVLDGAINLKDKCIAPLLHTLLLPFDEFDGITISPEARKIINDRNIDVPLKIQLIDKKTQRPLNNVLHNLALSKLANEHDDGHAKSNGNTSSNGNANSNANASVSSNANTFDEGRSDASNEHCRTVDDLAISSIDVLDLSKSGHLALYFDYSVFGQEQRIGYRHARRGSTLAPEIAALDEHDTTHLSYFDEHVHDHQSIFDELLHVEHHDFASDEIYSRYIDIVSSLMADEKMHFANEARRNQTKLEQDKNSGYTSKLLKLSLGNHNPSSIDSTFKYFSELGYFLTAIPEKLRIYAGNCLTDQHLHVTDFGIDCKDRYTDHLVLDSSIRTPLYHFPELFYRKAIVEQTESQRMCDFYFRLHSDIGNIFSPQEHASALAVKRLLKLHRDTDYVALKSGAIKSQNFALDAYISVYTRVATQMMYEYIFKHMHKNTATHSDDETIDCSLQAKIAISSSSANHGKSYITPLCAPSLLDDEQCCLVLGKSTVLVLEKMQTEYASSLCFDAQKRRAGLELLCNLIFTGCSCGHLIFLLSAFSVSHMHSTLDTGIYRGAFEGSLFFKKEYASLCLLQVLLQSGFNLMRANPFLVNFLLKDAYKDPSTPVNPFHATTKLRCMEALVKRSHAHDDEVIKQYAYELNAQGQAYKDYFCADREVAIACEYQLESLTEAELLELKTLDESDDLYAMTFGIAATKFFSYRNKPIYDLTELHEKNELKSYIQTEVVRRSLIDKSNYARYYMSKELHRHQALYALQRQGYECDIEDGAFLDINSTEFDRLEKLKCQALTCSIDLITRLLSFTGDMRFLSGLTDRHRLVVIRNYLALKQNTYIHYDVNHVSVLSCFAEELERRKFTDSLYKSLDKYASSKTNSDFAMHPLLHPAIERLDEFMMLALKREKILTKGNLGEIIKQSLKLYEKNHATYRNVLALIAKFVVLDKRLMRYRIIKEGTLALLMPHSFSDLRELLDSSVGYFNRPKSDAEQNDGDTAYGCYRGDLPLYPYNAKARASSFAYYADEFEYIYKPPMHCKLSLSYIKSVDRLLYVIGCDFIYRHGVFSESLIHSDLAFKTAMLLCNISWASPLACMAGELNERQKSLRLAQRRILTEVFDIYKDRLRGLDIANIMLACDDRDTVKLLKEDNIHEYLDSLCYYYGASSRNQGPSAQAQNDFANKQSHKEELHIAYKKPPEFLTSSSNEQDNTSSSKTASAKPQAQDTASGTNTAQSAKAAATKSQSEFSYTTKNIDSYFNYDDPLSGSFDSSSNSFSSTLSLGPTLTLGTSDQHKSQEQEQETKAKDKEPSSLLSSNEGSTLILTPVSSLALEPVSSESSDSVKPLTERFKNHNPFKDLPDDDEEDNSDLVDTAEQSTSKPSSTKESDTAKSDSLDADTAIETEVATNADYSVEVEQDTATDEIATDADTANDAADATEVDTSNDVSDETELDAAVEAEIAASDKAEPDSTVETEEDSSDETELDSTVETEVDDSDKTELDAADEAEVDASEETELNAADEAEVDASDEAELDAAVEAEEDVPDEAELNAAAVEAEVVGSDETELDAAVEAEVDDSDEAELNAPVEAEVDTADETEPDSTVETEADDSDETELDSTVETEVDDSDETELDAADEAEVDASEETELNAAVEAKVDASDETELDSTVETEADDSDETELDAAVEDLANDDDAVEAEPDSAVEVNCADDSASIEDDFTVAEADVEADDTADDVYSVETRLDEAEAPFIEDLDDSQSFADEDHELFNDADEEADESLDLSASDEKFDDSEDELDDVDAEDELEDEEDFATLAEQYLIKFSKQRYKKAIILTVLGFDAFFKFYKYRRRFATEEDSIKLCATACSHLINNELEYLHELLTVQLNETPDLGLDITFFKSNDDESYEESNDAAADADADLAKLSAKLDEEPKKASKNKKAKNPAERGHRDIMFYDYDNNDFALLQRDFKFFFDVLVEQTSKYLSKKDLISYYSLTEQEKKLKQYLTDQSDLQEIFNCLMPSQITYILNTVANS